MENKGKKIIDDEDDLFFSQPLLDKNGDIVPPPVFQPDSNRNSEVDSIKAAKRRNQRNQEEEHKLFSAEEPSFKKGKKMNDDFQQPPVFEPNQFQQQRKAPEYIQPEIEEPKYLEGEALLANVDQITDVKTLIVCVICNELATLKKDPQYCEQCQTATFCKECIEGWKKRKDDCPNCRAPKPSYKSVKQNKSLFEILKTIKVYCRYRNMGCLDIITFDQIEQHESECGECRLCGEEVIKKNMMEHFSVSCPKIMLHCQFCNTKGDRDFLKNSHICYNMQEGGKKNSKDYYFTKDRIINFNEMKQYYDSALKCLICFNVLRQPNQCKKCESSFCQKCIKEHRAKEDNCPSCKVQYPLFVDINRVLKNLLLKSKIRCIHCKLEFDYASIDEHELQCGKCHLCSSKYNHENRIPLHFLHTCPDYMIRCPLCIREYKRSKFNNHKCDPKQMENEDMAEVLKKISPVKQMDLKDINEHWRLKRKGCYCGGLGRWCKVYSLNTGKDLETKTKAFQVYFFMFFAIFELIISSMMILAHERDTHYWGSGPSPAFTYYLIGIILEYVLNFTLRIIFYGYLANNWEGYQKYNHLKVGHFFTYLFLTILPYFDFVLHLGYKQVGFSNNGIEEQFPVDFKVPTQVRVYKGYRRETRGGHFILMSMGYLRFATSFFRTLLWIVCLFKVERVMDYQFGPIVVIVLIGHCFLSFMMTMRIVGSKMSCGRKSGSRSVKSKKLREESEIVF